MEKSESDKRKICAKSLEKVLSYLDILNDNKAILIAHKGDISSIRVTNFKTYWTKDIATIKQEYRKHIPVCDECEEVYFNFLKNLKGYKNIKIADKKYLNVLNNPTYQHSYKNSCC